MAARIAVPVLLALSLVLSGCSAGPAAPTATSAPPSNAAAPPSPPPVAAHPWVGSFEGELVGEPAIVIEQGVSIVVIEVHEMDWDPAEKALFLRKPDGFGTGGMLPMEVHFEAPRSGSELAVASFGWRGMYLYGDADGTVEAKVDPEDSNPHESMLSYCDASVHPSSAAVDVTTAQDGRVESFRITAFVLADSSMSAGEPDCTVFAIASHDIVYTRTE